MMAAVVLTYWGLCSKYVLCGNSDMDREVWVTVSLGVLERYMCCWVLACTVFACMLNRAVSGHQHVPVGGPDLLERQSPTYSHPLPRQPCCYLCQGGQRLEQGTSRPWHLLPWS